MRGYLMPWSHVGITQFLREVAYQNGKISFQGLETAMKKEIKEREQFQLDSQRLMDYLRMDWDQRRTDADIILHRNNTDGLLLFYYFGYLDGDGTGVALNAYYRKAAKAVMENRTKDPNRNRDPSTVQRITFLDELIAGRSPETLKADILAKYRAMGIKFD